MRTKEIKIESTTYLLVMNNAVLKGMEDRGISLQDIGGGKPVSNLLAMLALMIKGGSDYAALTGLRRAKPPQIDVGVVHVVRAALRAFLQGSAARAADRSPGPDRHPADQGGGL